MDKGIQLSRDKHIGRVKLDRPQALNALTLPMIKALYKALLTWKKDPSIQAVVIEATESRAFCAGGDVRQLYEAGKHHDPTQLDFFWHEYRLNALIAAFGKPIIALMNGLTMGGGVGIGLHASHPIATERFVCAMPETAIGLFPDVGASYLYSRLPRGLGLYLVLTGARFGAADAAAVGLVRYVVPEASLTDLINNVLDYSHQNRMEPLFEAIRLEPGVLPTLEEPILAMIENCFTQPSVETIMKRLQTIEHPWALETLTVLKKCSPLSLKVTFLQMQKARTLSLADCLSMDAVLVKHFMKGHDFYEGVRAALIDKDKNPHWQPASLEEVTDEEIKGYF